MRRYLIGGGGLALVALLGVFVAPTLAPAPGLEAKRVQRYGGRAWPRPVGTSCSDYAETTNFATYSQQLDDASWLLLGNISAAPSVTANAAAAPPCSQINITGCGTNTAEEFVFADTTSSSAAYSFAASLTGCTGPTCTIQGWFKAKTLADEGPIDVFAYGGVPIVNCSIVSTAYTRCSRANFNSGGDAVIGFGNFTGSQRAARTVLVWQLDSQDSATVTPGIKTTSASVTRAAGCY